MIRKLLSEAWGLDRYETARILVFYLLCVATFVPWAFVVRGCLALLGVMR